MFLHGFLDDCEVQQTVGHLGVHFIAEAHWFGDSSEDVIFVTFVFFISWYLDFILSFKTF